MARLFSIIPPGEVNFELKKELIRIGRMPDNDIVLNDSLISRKHCELRREGEHWKLVDLSSLNGVYVNKLRVSDTLLAPGDIIAIGNFQLVFEEKFKSQPEVPPAIGPELIKPVRELGQELGLDARLEQENERLARDREARYFYILYQITRALNGANNLNEILDLSLELVFQVINAERGVIMLLDKKGELELRSVRVRSQNIADAIEITVSKTIARRALEEKSGLITNDAKYDPRFKSGQSIIACNIRSALCVPIWEREEIRGVIYLDNLLNTYAFSEEDLKLLTAIANQMAMAIRQEELQDRMKEEAVFRTNLARFHSPDVVNQIIEHSKHEEELRLQVAEREVTVLFADICQFTSLSEKTMPEQLSRLLNDYFDQMSNIVFKYKGTVDKFIGDCIMAIFGAPISYGNDAELAIYAAIEMLQQLHEFRKSLEPDKRFQVRIGINTGMVVAGYLGSSQRLEYTVLGDSVNIAARLQQLAPPSAIYIGEATYQRVKGAFSIRDLGAIQLKGKEKKINVYMVVPPSGEIHPENQGHQLKLPNRETF
jgi:adenylate cyclase